jgi:hypothetical protein
MIFFNSQLMRTKSQLRVFLVTNPRPFERFEDHEAAIQINLYELVQQAFENKENPVGLIEDTLKVTYNSGNSIDEIVGYLINTDQMLNAMFTLRDHWIEFDPGIDGDSLLYGYGITRTDAVESFSHNTFRNFLEALTSMYNE